MSPYLGVHDPALFAFSAQLLCLDLSFRLQETVLCRGDIMSTATGALAHTLGSLCTQL